MDDNDLPATANETKVETVKVVSDDHPEGFVVINRSDFDPEKHEEFAERKQRAPAPKADPAKKDETDKKPSV